MSFSVWQHTRLVTKKLLMNFMGVRLWLPELEEKKELLEENQLSEEGEEDKHPSFITRLG